MSTTPDTKTNEPPATDMVTIEVNDRSLQVAKGSMIIQATDAAGIYIPRFCYHHKLSVAANCRMCLIEVEKAPKPLPACATPVAEGMKVFTRSEVARDAQKGVMEFLLINHPLDCPVCDQGGECPLQDLALGYGKDVSRYSDKKRVVHDKDIGPLITTEMTRCIHCTRCVRFGQEIGGIMEIGATGRGEHTEIGTFIERSVDSELSGNVIDLCPVGALTSKPYRFTARAWELISHDSVSPHDCVGSNLNIQTRRNRVMRVLPRDNESINECWLPDRDRYSYEALNSHDRLRSPMIRVDGRWAATDWNTALEFAATGLHKVINKHGAERLGALAAPTATVEEFYLLQKLVRGLGSANVDHRLRQLDFSDDGAMPMFPGLGQEIQDLEKLEAVLLVGTNIRKDQPMLAHRLRKAQLKGAHIMAINPVDYTFTYHLSRKVITNPADMVRSLARVAKALADAKGIRPAGIPAWFSALQPSEAERQIAEFLASKERTAVLLGNLAISHPHATELRALAALVADFASATFGQLSEANSVGAWLAGCIPHRGPNGSAVSVGQDAHTMISEPLKAYLLLGVEPELDCLDGHRARQAMAAAEFVVMLTPFKPTPANTDAMKYADVLLPLAPFTETAGTFVNCEGRWQSFSAAAQPLADTRPGWKILRVLANRLRQPGFEYVNIVDVRSEIERPSVDQGIKPKSLTVPANIDGMHNGLCRIVETPIYAVDNLVRRAPSLQATADNPPPAVRMNAAQATALGLDGVEQVVVRVGDGSATLDLVIDPRVADHCVLVPAGYSQTASLAAHGEATIEKTD